MIKTALNLKRVLFAFLLVAAGAASATAVTAQSSNSIFLDTSAYDISVCVSEDWLDPLNAYPAAFLITVQ